MDPRYSTRIGESYCLSEDVSYEVLLQRIMEFTVRAAVARSIDESEWEHEELRRKGLSALQIVRNGKAVWLDQETFEGELAEARREHIESGFKEANELDPSLYQELDNDLRARWRSAGYETPSLITDMKKLFAELQRDAAHRIAGAMEDLIREIMVS
jgi:hypothetical protein